jgi:hypothetical protein
MYESYQNSPSLFTVIGSEELILIAEVSRLNLIIEGVFESWEMYEDIHSKMEELRNHLKKNDVSELSVEIICEMIKNESFTLDVLVRMIAQPGQIINIQYTNITYGNTEFNVVT